MFVAVVYKHHTEGPKSHRDTGGWESFLGYTQEEAIDQAATAVKRWESEGCGPYQILTGEVL